MNDSNVRRHIEELVAEEHRLFEQRGSLDDAQRARLDEINVQLDRYYDLLRQRRARREFGQDPDQARIRSAQTVERYRQ